MRSTTDGAAFSAGRIGARATPPISQPEAGAVARASRPAASAPLRVAYLVSHPIQYQAPLLRFLSRDPRLELEVLFLSDISVGEFIHPAYRQRHAWDVPLLEGYRHRFLDAWGRTNRLGRLRPFTRGLTRALQTGGYDALWIHGWGHQANLRALASAKKSGLPVLLRAETTCEPSRGFPRSALRGLLHQWVLERTSAALAIGTANRRFYEAAGFPPERTFPMPYTVDNDFFRAGAQEARATRAELRAELRIPAGAPVVLYGSRLVRHKRPDDLLQAFRSLGSKHGDARLVFVGDGPERARLEVLAGTDLGERVHFVGFQNQTRMPRWYDLCDVFCLPSAYEPWGLVVNEAMCAERPVIVSDRVGCAVDLVEDGKTGWVVPAERPELLAERLAAALSDRDRLREMGRRAGRHIATQSFEADRAGLFQALNALVVRT